MSYEFTSEPRAVWWPVTVNVPRDDGVDNVKIRVRYLLPKRSVVRSPDFKNENAAKYVLDWSGIVGGDKLPIPFTPENLAALREDAFFENALAIGLFQAANGAAEKN